MHRFIKHQYIIRSSISSKGLVFNSHPLTLRLKIIAGLYKPNSVQIEHSLILSSLSSAVPVAYYQLHGKRGRRTISLSNVLNKNSHVALDKIIHEQLPRISDFRTIKVKKPSNNNYSLRLKEKFSPLVDFEDLVSNNMFEEHRGIFLPLNLHLLLANTVNRIQIPAHYLRMSRIPFNFYANRPMPAFDDFAIFNQGF